MPDKALAERLQARRGYPHGAGAVRSARDRAEPGHRPQRQDSGAHWGRAAPSQRRVEGGGGSEGGAGPTILERAAREGASKHHALGACTEKPACSRFWTSRSKATPAEADEEFPDVHATADWYAGRRGPPPPAAAAPRRARPA